MSRCPKCRIPFSDWFVWIPGLRFCFPCWMESGFTNVVTERASEPQTGSEQ